MLLPPEYDPYRLYPTVITLNTDAATTPLQQIDWWAGAASEKGRMGQATRQGYIVIAPAWTRPHQTAYNASPEAHDCISARFAMPHAASPSIPTASISVDIRWAAMQRGKSAFRIRTFGPALSRAADYHTRMVNHYTANAAALPMYFVAGELDETASKTTASIGLVISFAIST